MLSRLHHGVIKHIINCGYAPDVCALAHELDEPLESVQRGLMDLEEYHGVVLHPNSYKVWVIHPFSLAPSNFVVSTEDGKWFSSCAWCALGCAALLNKNCTITTTFEAHGERIDVHIQHGEVIEGDLLIHFPIPMRNAWDNVIYTCSNMLLFRTQTEVEKWCLRHGMEMGDVQPLSKMWPFAQEWYGNHLSETWVKWTAPQAQEMFSRHDLTHDVWNLHLDGDNNVRF